MVQFQIGPKLFFDNRKCIFWDHNQLALPRVMSVFSNILSCQMVMGNTNNVRLHVLCLVSGFQSSPCCFYSSSLTLSIALCVDDGFYYLSSMRHVIQKEKKGICRLLGKGIFPFFGCANSRKMDHLVYYLIYFSNLEPHNLLIRNQQKQCKLLVIIFSLTSLS